MYRKKLRQALGQSYIYNIRKYSLQFFCHNEKKVLPQNSQVQGLRAVELRTTSMMDGSFPVIEGPPLLSLLVFCTVPVLSNCCTNISILYVSGPHRGPGSLIRDSIDDEWIRKILSATRIYTIFSFCCNVKTIITRIWKLM